MATDRRGLFGAFLAGEQRAGRERPSRVMLQQISWPTSFPHTILTPAPAPVPSLSPSVPVPVPVPAPTRASMVNLVNQMSPLG